MKYRILFLWLLPLLSCNIDVQEVKVLQIETTEKVVLNVLSLNENYLFCAQEGFGLRNRYLILTTSKEISYNPDSTVQLIINNKYIVPVLSYDVVARSDKMFGRKIGGGLTIILDESNNVVRYEY